MKFVTRALMVLIGILIGLAIGHWTNGGQLMLGAIIGCFIG